MGMSGVSFRIVNGEARAVLETLEADSADAMVTSPPYWAQRENGHSSELGLERHMRDYVANLVAIFEAAKPVLKPSGNLFVVIGDTYSSKTKGSGGATHKQTTNAGSYFPPRPFDSGLPDKSLCGVPWRFAIAMQDAGWLLRAEVVWHKPNGMCRPDTQRVSRTHETIFHFTRTGDNYFDWQAAATIGQGGKVVRRRSVWTVPTRRGYKPKGAARHYSSYPGELIRPCILAGSPVGGTVLDPFSGTGTTGAEALAHGRHYIGIELVSAYALLSGERLAEVWAARAEGLVYMGEEAANG